MARNRKAGKAGRKLLVGAALGALNTANAQKPLTTKGRAGIGLFMPGLLTSELPLHTIALQALLTANHARKGALRTVPGLVGLGITAASWVQLHKVWKQSMGAGEVFDKALEEGLGPWAEEGGSPLQPEPVVLDRGRLVRGPLTQHRRRWVKGPSQSYGEFGRRNLLDIWRRPDLPADAKAPVLLQVHGGAWIMGNKDQQAMPLLATMAERGWVCVSINYRLSPRSSWPDHIVDVKRAIAWVKEHIAEYGGDPEFVCITGGSAGGHLSSLAALTPNQAEFQPGFEDADTSVAAAVPFYGVYDWTNRDGTGRADMEDILARMVLKVTRADDALLWDHASTMSWVNEDAPPFFVVHGDNDSLVPVAQARSFVAMLRQASHNPVAYAELPGAQHAFELFDSPRTFYSAGAVHRFLEAVRARAGHVAEVGAG